MDLNILCKKIFIFTGVIPIIVPTSTPVIFSNHNILSSFHENILMYLHIHFLLLNNIPIVITFHMYFFKSNNFHSYSISGLDKK